MMHATAPVIEQTDGTAGMSWDIIDSVPPTLAATPHAVASLAIPTIEVISDLAGFDRLTAEWNALHDINQHNRLSFQSHAWLRSWFATYNDETEPRSEQPAIVILRIAGRIRLICPLSVRQTLGMTHLAWLGQPASQYGDVITDGTAAAQPLVASAMRHAINTFKPDIIHLRKVREDAAVQSWLASHGATPTTSDLAPYLDFTNAASFDEYCARYSAKSRKNRRRLRRRLEETGNVSTTVLQCGDAAGRAIETGVRFKRQWLIERGHVSSGLRDGHMPDLICNFVNRTDRFAKPFVSIMHCGDTPVSVQFGVISKQRLALHMIAYNPETEKTGAGVLHVEDTIAHCIENGLVELDFLAPDAAYKQAWADASMPVHDYVIPQTIKGRLYAQGYLCSTRNALKTRVASLPLGLRRNIAKCMQN
jgi:CelD/BcsL family acetyltransferase involved in cellulose biosynthesis